MFSRWGLAVVLVAVAGVSFCTSYFWLYGVGVSGVNVNVGLTVSFGGSSSSPAKGGCLNYVFLVNVTSPELSFVSRGDFMLISGAMANFGNGTNFAVPRGSSSQVAVLGGSWVLLDLQFDSVCFGSVELWYLPLGVRVA